MLKLFKQIVQGLRNISNPELTRVLISMLFHMHRRTIVYSLLT